MTLLLAGLWACTEPRPPTPRPSRFDDPIVEPGPEAPKPGPDADGDPEPDTEPGEPEPGEPEITGVTIGDAGPIPEITQDDKNRWRKTGGRSDVSQPEFPTPAISPDQCEDVPDGGPLVAGQDCITAEVTCESRTIGHTLGGADRFSSKFYEKKRCWPSTKDHDSGNERVYKLVMPEGEWRAWATLYTPCADLDLAAVRHDHGGCPTLGSNVGPCEMTVNDYNHAERIEMTTQTKFKGQRPVWYIIVEGKDDAEGLFELDIQCRPGVGGSVDP